MSFDQTNTLERSLTSTPQIRPDKVAQAAALVADGNYPSDAQLSRLAGLLAAAGSSAYIVGGWVRDVLLGRQTADIDIAVSADPHDTARMVADALDGVERRSGGSFAYAIRNDNRSIGARLSGEIARRHGDQGMSGAPIRMHFAGTAGQSFGVWNAGGLHLYLEGDANDYVGKGMAGGRIVIRPPAESNWSARDTVIMGNTCLYGATGGRLYAAGQAGERLAVRNSGAVAVVGGVGDHGCEYMTGGAVAVLGGTGLNFGAGMTGGLAFVLDADGTFTDHYNHELIDIHRLQPEPMEAYRLYLRTLLEEHVRETGSPWGGTLLEQFDAWAPKFWLAKPRAADLETLLDTLRQAA